VVSAEIPSPNPSKADARLDFLLDWAVFPA